MKTYVIQNREFLISFVAGAVVMLAARVTAQNLTSLYHFPELANPNAGLTLSGGTLYGTTLASDGYGGSGMVFEINTDGTGFSILNIFSGSYSSSLGVATNVGGASPSAGLVLSGHILYGTASSGGRGGYGTVFALNTDGSGFRVLHDFSRSGSDGANPQAPLTLSGNTLYGTAQLGGQTNGTGTVFALKTDGTGFTTLHTFSLIRNSTNSDGARPYGKLVLSGNSLYGTTDYGGASDVGTVFKVNTDGTGFATLHNFSGGEDGGYMDGGLILSSNTLYGVTLGINSHLAYSGGGPPGSFGTIFAIETDGTGFRVLHSFAPFNGRVSSSGSETNSDGAEPVAGLTLSGNTLYGATLKGGSTGEGTVFMVNPDGTRFTTLHTFEVSTGLFPINTEGIRPTGELVLSGNTLYGIATAGGTWGYGTVFSIVSPPQLSMTPVGQNVILTWPTNFTGFTLQSTTNLVSPAWITNLPAPFVVNGQYTVTNSVSGTQQFFRLAP